MPGFVVVPKDGAGFVPPSPSSKMRYYYTYSWDITSVFDIDADLDIKTSEAIQNGSLSPFINLKECTLPTISFGKESVKGASLEYKFAKDVSWDDIRVTWYDALGMIKIIKAWRKMVWSHEKGLSPPSYYKRSTKLYTFLPDSSNTNFNDVGDIYWVLVNSWPSIIKHGDLTYTDSDAKVIDVTITYDWAHEDFKDGSYIGNINPPASYSG